MGLYDRDYYRPQRSTFSLRGPRTIVGTLVLLNVVFYLANAIFTPAPENQITRILSVTAADLTQPLHWWKFLTYGFAHDTHPQHIIFNMLGLFFLGAGLEELYGRKEFLRIYLVALLVGSVAWAVANQLTSRYGSPFNLERTYLLGASGAVAAIVVLYAVNFPHRTIMLFFVLPVPAWFAGLLLVGFDLYGAVAKPDSHVAYTVHLAGAAFAFLYYRGGWNFGRLLPERWFSRRARLRVRRPDEAEEEGQDELDAEVDRILDKYNREGAGSLTRKERRILKNASKEYQRRRRGGGGEEGPGDEA